MYLDNPHIGLPMQHSVSSQGPGRPFLLTKYRRGIFSPSDGAPGGANRAESGGQEFLEACKLRRHAADTSDAQEGGFEEKNVKNPGDAFMNNE